MSKQNFIPSVVLACDWLIDRAQVKNAQLVDVPGRPESPMNYTDWRGAIKGEYIHAQRKWSFFGTIWHTGQAVCALTKAYGALNEPRFLYAARFSADFILRHQITDPTDEDYGLILAYEDDPDRVNTSAIMEATTGLLELHRVTGENKYLNASKIAVDWVVRKMFLPQEALFVDCYEPRIRQILSDRYGTVGRPLVEDAAFLKVGKLTNDRNLMEIFFQVLHRLLKDEDPPGNWIKYAPCNAQRGSLHPRHAYWWGLPFLDGYQQSKDAKYLDAAIRAGRWYVQAQRHDGGLFRGTYRDFSTDSFGHATSGMACAVKMWTRLWNVTQSPEWLEPIRKGLQFCLSMQITNPTDENLKGVIVEKILPPDGTDRSLLYVRDLGAIFYIQAVCEVLSSGILDHLTAKETA